MLAKQLIGEVVDLGFSGDKATLRSYKASMLSLQTSLAKIGTDLPEAVQWTLFLEFQLPRRQKRLDLVLLARDRIIIGEFKTGAGLAGRSAAIQVEDYALDLRDFHETSANRLIVPVVIGNRGSVNLSQIERSGDSPITETLVLGPDELEQLWRDVVKIDHPFDQTVLDPDVWQRGRYLPVPPILEAALYLYKSHQVRDIAACSAGNDNLTLTVETVRDAVLQALKEKQRVICFVTGVPGSGKTLAGLSSVHAEYDGAQVPPSTFLSGNIPLVKVLREALVRDSKNRSGISKQEAERQVRSFVESMHAFIEEHGLKDVERPPVNSVIVFDEAQRAWDDAQMIRKEKGSLSEPALLLEIMGRHEGAAIIALVGGGQEIHRGEAGLKGWGEALSIDQRWKVLASPAVIDGSCSMGGSKLFESGLPEGIETIPRKYLHLDVPRRTIRSTSWNEWVEKFLGADTSGARAVAENLDGFEARVTRSLEAARSWLKSRTRGTRRCGLVSSSGNLRVRAFGVETSSGFRASIDWPAWFLNDETDVRSSSYLEVAASEFECQGLELDEVALCWGGDFLLQLKEFNWEFRSFKGGKWTNIVKLEDQQFVRSKYRVLLTRARSGMVIWIPENKSSSDSTIDSNRFDWLYEVIVNSGIRPLESS